MEQIKTYEIRLKQEFKNLQKLQQRKEIDGIINIEYKDRKTGERQSIMKPPASINMYPERFYITYKMPVFTGRNNLNNDWQGELTFQVSKDSLLNGNSNPCELNCKGRYPFNHHVSPGS